MKNFLVTPAKSVVCIVVLAMVLTAATPHPVQSGWVSSLIKAFTKGAAKNADELLNAGKKARQEGDYDAAYKAFEEATEKGNVDATTEMAMMRLKGQAPVSQSGGQDISEAWRIVIQAAARGHRGAKKTIFEECTQEEKGNADSQFENEDTCDRLMEEHPDWFQSSELSEQGLTMAQAIQEQMGSCWQIDDVAQGAEDIVVKVQVVLNPDGSVNAVQIVDMERMVQDDYFRSAAEDVKRAIMRCDPFHLPVEKYEVWKHLTLRFDPRHAKANLPLEDQQ